MTYKHMKECIEKKFHDSNRTSTVIGTQGSPSAVSLVSGIAQNTTATGRVGIRAYIWEIMVRGSIELPQSDDLDLYDQIRIVIVQDKQANGDTPASADLFTIGGASNIDAFRNLGNTRRYVLLHDQVITMNAQAAAADTVTTYEVGKKLVKFSYHKRFPKGIKVVYTVGDTAGLSATIKDNNIWVFAFTAAGVIKMNWNGRIRYTD